MQDATEDVDMGMESKRRRIEAEDKEEGVSGAVGGSEISAEHRSEPSAAVGEVAMPSSSNGNSSHENSTEEEPTAFRVFTNDNSDESCVALITLKNIFSKQLPKMPKEYIVRLVFDRRHVTLALLKGKRIIGGVCYRPYFDQHFAEIAFLAISAAEQVRGYGTLLMNQLKSHVQPKGMYVISFCLV